MGEDYSDITICYAQIIFTQNLRTALSFRKASHVFEYFEKREKLHPGNLRELKLGRISHQHPAREMVEDYSDMTIYKTATTLGAEFWSIGLGIIN